MKLGNIRYNEWNARREESGTRPTEGLLEGVKQLNAIAILSTL